MAKHKKYMVTAVVTISVSTVVEATSKKEALDIAYERSLTRIVDRGHKGREWCTSGELDGIPQSLVAELYD